MSEQSVEPVQIADIVDSRAPPKAVDRHKLALQVPETAAAHAALSHMRTLLLQKSLDEAGRVASALLATRIAAGDVELCAAGLLLKHCMTILSRLPPLGHIETASLRPSDEIYACFDQFIDLLRQQGQQIAELQAILFELI